MREDLGEPRGDARVPVLAGGQRGVCRGVDDLGRTTDIFVCALIQDASAVGVLREFLNGSKVGNDF